MKNRWMNAGIAFTLAFAAAGVVWQNGRHEGLKETTQAVSSPTPLTSAITPISGRTVSQDSRRLAELRSQSETAQTVDQKRETATALYDLAHTAHNENRGGGALSRDAYLLALQGFHEMGDWAYEVIVLTDLSDTQQLLGQRKEAESSLRTALALHRSHHGLLLKEADILYRLGDFLRFQGRYAEAKACLNDSLTLRQKAGEEGGIADCLQGSGQVAFEEGSPALARQLFEESARLFAKNGGIESRAAVLGQLGDVALAQGDTTEAERLYQEGLSVWQKKRQDFWIGRFLSRLAQVSLQRNDLAKAKRLAEQANRLLSASNGPVSRAGSLRVLGEIALREGRYDEAGVNLNQALSLYNQAGYAYGIARCQKALETLATAAKG